MTAVDLSVFSEEQRRRAMALILAFALFPAASPGSALNLAVFVIRGTT